MKSNEYDIHISQETQTIRASCHLQGEAEPIHLIAKYKIENTALILQDFSCDRKWLQEILSLFQENYLQKHKKPFSLPLSEFLADGLRRFL